MPRSRVVVAMSGGVDSSVAAALLLEQGYEVVGVTMRLWTVEDPEAARHHRRCCSVEDSEDARAACDRLGILHYILNFEREFATGVVDRFVQEYGRGRTPNPCIECNNQVKFRPLLAHALALGADYLATGHYVRLRRPDGPRRAPVRGRPSGRNGRGYEMWRAADRAKDQSYVLYALGQRELSRALFPVGEHTKEEIRAIARRYRLPNADKADSTDICFIPSGDYRSFVGQRAASQPGDILDTAGNRLGRHPGIVSYTVGQRRGLPPTSRGEPLYVVGVDAEANAVVVGPEEELVAPGLIADGVSFVSGEAPREPFQAQARIRYRGPAAPATVEMRGDTAEVRFHHPQRAVTPGQAVVLYDGERVLGGGTIAAPLGG